MEVKKGYKLSDIGIIPNDWGIHYLGEIINYVKGYAFKSSDYKNDGTRIIRVSDISMNKISDEKAVYVDEPKDNRYRKWGLNESDLIITTVGSKPPIWDSLVGKVVKVDKKYKKALLNQNAVLIRAKNHDITIQNLIFFNLKTDRYVRHIEGIFRGNANQASITLVDLFIFKLALPSDENEKKAIAETISDMDALITALDALIAKKRAIKQGVMQELLTGKTRLYGFNKEWVEKALGEIGVITGSGVDKKVRVGEKPVRLLNFLDVYSKDFIYSCDLHQMVTTPVQKAQQCAIKKGDIFFTPSSEMPYDIGFSTVSMEDIQDGVYSYHVVRLRLDDSCDWDLLFRTYIFKTQFFIDQAERICAGSGQRYVISLKSFKSLRVFYPQDKEEQKAISEILFSIDMEITTLEKRRDKNKALKQGMMQELLTGRIRLMGE